MKKVSIGAATALSAMAIIGAGSFFPPSVIRAERRKQLAAIGEKDAEAIAKAEAKRERKAAKRRRASV